MKRCRTGLGIVSLAICLGALVACAPRATDDGTPRPGLWRATLQLPGGELPFGLEFATESGKIVAFLDNGPDRAKVTDITRDGKRLTLRLDGFENRIDATLEGDTLRGTLTMIKSRGKQQEIPFAARYGETHRFTKEPPAPIANVAGRWATTFVDEGESSIAVGEFTQNGAIVTGTFLTPTGDHRFLAGELRGRELSLSKFDGGHAFLYRATLGDDGVLRGRFWSGLASLETFEARRDESASLGDSESATQLVANAKPLDFSFPDVAGHQISIRDPFFRGKVVIVTLAGSWCPNCHDEAALLAEMHRRKRDRGLEVISLMFEQFGDFERAREAVYRFRDRHRVGYTTLVAGISDKDDAASKLPQLNGVYAFPTTIFVDRSGRVRKIHTGFSGPATGQHYDRLVADFDKLTDDLLAEPIPPTPRG
jgi:thiol-disulfide isomerase/thioredoxin